MKIIGIQKIQSESFFNAEVTALNTLTVGVDGTGHDAKFFGDTSGQFLLWDQSSDELVLAGDTKLSFHDAAGGENIIASADGHLEINAETTLDITATTIDINGAADISGDFTLAGTAIATVIAGTTVTNATNATTATNVTVADESTDTTCFPLFATAATGDLPPKSGTNLTFNSSTGLLTSTLLAGALTGNVTGNADTATTAAKVTVADESTDTFCNVLFVTAATGNLPPKSGTNLYFNSATGKLSATIFESEDRIITSIREFKKSGSSVGTRNGDVVFFGNTESMVVGKVYHFKNDGTWELVNASAVATSDGLLAVALGNASNDAGMLIRGFVTLEHDPGAIGDVLYASHTATGEATATKPTGSGNVVRIIGYCLGAEDKKIYFNPDGHHTVL